MAFISGLSFAADSMGLSSFALHDELR